MRCPIPWDCLQFPSELLCVYYLCWCILLSTWLCVCVCVGALGLLTCICEIYIGFQITLSLRITLVSKAVFVSVFAYLIFALAVKFYHFIFFFIQQKSGFQQEIKCQTSEGVTEQQKLSQKELTKNIAWRKKKKNTLWGREKHETSLTNNWLATLGKAGKCGFEECIK